MAHRRTIVRSVLGWTAFGLIFALQNYAYGTYLGHPVVFSTTLIVWLICAYAWLVFTPAMIYLASRFQLSRGSVLRNLPVHIVAGALISFFQLTIFVLVRQALLGSPEKPFSFGESIRSVLISEFPRNYLIFWVVTGICHFRLINRRYIERQSETARLALERAQLETQLAQARLDSLKMQLHPHFLFNTLNSISVLMRDDTDAANKMLVRLSELLRIALKSANEQEVTLKDELDFLLRYLEIEKVRFQDRLQFEFKIDDEALESKVPNLILQPIVENAIKHGIAPSAVSGVIKIVATRDNGSVHLVVADNGPGFDATADDGKGIGLRNTKERLRKLYADRHEFIVTSGALGGVRVEITLPFNAS
jgi:two-component system, LytTR family, sensor kinase